MSTDFNSRHKELNGPTIKFELRDKPDKENSIKHKKKIVCFHGEYGEDTCLYWCQFEVMLRQIIKKKPCTTPEAMYGVTRACLTGKALSDSNHFANELKGGEMELNFKETLMMLKEDIFDVLETPQADQIEYLKT
eukprot:2086935-Ditylum_brightwellii.AAC.1